MILRRFILSFSFLFFCYLPAMDCFVTRTFNKEPLTQREQKNLLDLLKQSPIYLDENGNTILHAAAAVFEWPEAVNELILARPDLAEYMHQPNNKGIRPADIVAKRQERQPQISQHTLHSKALQTNVAALSREQIKLLDDSIDAKLTLSDQNKPHAPFTDLEKGRILGICIQCPYPLHFAALVHQYPEMICHLLVYNPHLKSAINTRNQQGQTPLAIAIAKGNGAAQSILRYLGGQ